MCQKAMSIRLKLKNADLAAMENKCFRENTSKCCDAQYEVTDCTSKRQKILVEKIHKRSRSIHVIRMAASKQVCFLSFMACATLPDCS